MAGFDHIDTAAALRDIMKEAAKQVVETEAPGPSYGRVISINAPALTATVWFPGDEAPVSVNMFPNAVPGQWHEQFTGSGGGVLNTSYFGYGSQVAVQNFNGKVYITQILTGGILSVDAKLFNANLVTQVATEVASDLAGRYNQVIGEPHETFINCHISNDTLTDGNAISFGPFTTANKSLPGIGWIEVTVTELNGAVKHYNLPINPERDFEHTGGNGFLDAWFRVIPEKQITDAGGGQIIDFDFEIAIKRTVYGNIDEFFPDEELWMRVIKRGTGWTGFYANVTIRGTNIQRGRSLSGRELFMQETLTSPPEAKGYVGFHNAQMIFRDFDDYGVLDNMGRTINGGGWGISDSGPSWIIKSGAASNFGVDGSAAYISSPSNTVNYITINQTNTFNTDMYWDTWISVMPTGAEVQTGAVMRYRDTSNLYYLKCIFNTSGLITLSFAKGLAGAFSNIGTDFATGMTFTAFERIRVRARVFDSAMFIKAWKPASMREPDWVKIDVDGTIGGNAANVVGFFTLPGAGNTNTKPFRVYFDNVRASLYPKGQDNVGTQWHTGPWRSGLLRMGDNLQKTWVCTGRFYWSGTHIRWDQRIYFSGVGQNRLGLAAGSTMMQFPPTTFTVPVVPNGGTVSITAGGIPLTVGQALWVGIPPGQTWENLYEYLFIVDVNQARDFDLPEWAVLIAMRSDATEAPIRLGNGEYIDKWRSPSYASGWSDYASGGHELVKYRRDSGNEIVRIRGLCKNTNVNATGTIFTLPNGFRPDATQMFNCASQNGGATQGASRVDIQPDGQVVVIGHQTNGGAAFLSLSGITFDASIIP